MRHDLVQLLHDQGAPYGLRAGAPFGGQLGRGTGAQPEQKDDCGAQDYRGHGGQP
ncbi:hypothetical protein ACWENQ_04930 [Nonomuraea sp. NPDC004354]